jgi:tetratricopeptide (TPR) repeat protein
MLHSAQQGTQALEAYLESLLIQTVQISSVEQAQQIVTAFAALDPNILLSSVEVAQTYTLALAEAREATALFEFVQRFQSRFEFQFVPPIMVAYSWALIQRGDIKQAHELLTKLVQRSDLNSQTMCLAWQRLMLAQHFMGRNWQEARDQYRQGQQSRNYALGLLLEGFILHKNQVFKEARLCYREALSYFRQDTFHYARIHYNLGITDLLECHHDCTRHFTIAFTESKKSQGQQFLSVALTGLGAAYCFRGNWQAAETAYLRAIEVATEHRDYRQAYLNLARTYRLQHRTHEALETLIFAAAYLPDDIHEVQLERAAAYLLEDNSDFAEKNLQAIRVGGADIWLAQILKAELERQAGNIKAMLEALYGIPLQSRLAREEARVFPELFSTAAKLGMESPEPLPETKNICIKAKVVGVLEVLADEQPIELDAVCLGAQVLVYLIEHQHSCTTEELVNAIWFDLPRDKYHSKRRQVWQAVQRLNKIMPIDEAVETSKSGVYRLSKHLEWQTDLAPHQQVKAYLTGMHSHWIDKKRRQLGLEKP